MSARRVRITSKTPLKGVRVLVGRARHQASALSSALQKLGAEVIEIPFIEIRKPRSFYPLDSALKNLGSYDWLILTSVNGVEAMWDRMGRLGCARVLEGHACSRAGSSTQWASLAAEGGFPRIAAIGPATKKAIEERGATVNVVPKEYVAESVVRSLRRRVRGKRVLLVRAKVARDVIPRELRKAGAHVDVVEAYETVVPLASRSRLRQLLKRPDQRPHVLTFTSSSSVRNFVKLLGGSRDSLLTRKATGLKRRTAESIQFASIGPVTSSTLREFGLPVGIQAAKFTIPGLVRGIVRACAR
jgi:uroporphyrinogen-III synthase